MTPAEIADQLCELIASETRGMDTVATRIVANRIARVIEPWLPLRDKSAATLVQPMTNSEARVFEQETIEFGKHAGTKFKDVPLDYLIWLADKCRRTWRKIHAYLDSDRVRGELRDLEDSNVTEGKLHDGE
ncbi:MAG: hypothetical protein A2W31_11495 [Planctomycetes bacterium RBG_16_64_10]|nr:MAG: hypothetical protein A2W31_11495 [Planctomycetes bacterium RBG_16_64_10]